MRPRICYPANTNKYVYFICKCELPLGMAIAVERIPGKTKYQFKCDECGTAGTVYVGSAQF